MPDFLRHLAARTLGLAPVAQPVVPVMYAAEGAQPKRSPSLSLEEVDTVVFRSSPATERQSSHSDSTRRLNVTPEAPLVPVQRGPVTPAAHDAPYSLSAGPRHRESDFPQAPRLPFQAEREFAAAVPPIAPETSTSPIAESRVWATSPLAAGGEHERVVAALATPRREMTAETNSPAAGPSRLATEPIPMARRALEAPVIRVNIGRVEVRAEFPPPVSRPVAKRSQSSALSLEEYARQRKEGLR